MKDTISTRIRSYADVHALLQRSGHPLGGGYTLQDRLTLSCGFLPEETEVTCFPESHAAWDRLNRELPRLLADGTLLQRLATFPVLDASAAALPERYLGRASSFLGYAVHTAYGVFKALQPVQASVKPTDFVTPTCLDRPWCQVMERLQRPFVGMTLTDFCYTAVRRRDPARPPTTRNLDTDLGMTGIPSERVSQATLPAVEYAAHWCLQGIDRLYVQKRRLNDGTVELPGEATRTQAAIREAIALITSGILEMGRAVQSLDVHRAPPEVWHIVTALWGSTRASENGFDGTSAPSFQMLDCFFGRRQYETELGRMTQEQFGQRIPAFQRDVLLAIRNEDFPAVIRAATARWPEAGDFGWNRCIEEHHAVLRAHLRRVFGFLEVGRLVTGRDSTNGRLHERLAHQHSAAPAHRDAHPQDFYDAFERAIQERDQPERRVCTVMALSQPTAPDVFRVQLSVPDSEPPLYAFPGDHLEVRLPDSETVRLYSLSTVAADRRSATMTIARQGLGSRFVIGEPGVAHALTVRVVPSSFRLPADPGVPIALIAGGSGISPFLGFIESRAAVDPAQRGLTLVFVSVRTEESFPCAAELAAFAAAGVIQLHVCYTGAPQRATIATLLQENDDALQAVLTDVEGSVFVCGRTGFCRAVQDALEASCQRHGATTGGVNARVQYECFATMPKAAADASGLPWIDWACVRQHNHRDSAWIVIAGVVYDVTAYMKHHPGSEALLLLHAGTDATKAFQFAHAGQHGVLALLQEMRIGRVLDTEPDTQEQLANAAARTWSRVAMLDRVASREVLVVGDDIALRPWRAHVVTTAWLGHLREGVIPLLLAAIGEQAAPMTTVPHIEDVFNTVLQHSRGGHYDEASHLLKTFTAPVLAWLPQLAEDPTAASAAARGVLHHLGTFVPGTEEGP